MIIQLSKCNILVCFCDKTGSLVVETLEYFGDCGWVSNSPFPLTWHPEQW
jgi:hypothetical protein